MPTASLLTHRDRQRAALNGAAANVWHRDHGTHRRTIAALLHAVDTGQLGIRDAHQRIVALSHDQRRAA